MKQVWNVFVFLGYSFGIDKLLLTKADMTDEQNLELSTGENGTITCEDNTVIKINDAIVYPTKNYCVGTTRNECVISNDDYRSIVTQCDNIHQCTVDFPKNTPCLKEDRYFNLSYSCLAASNGLCTFEFSSCNWQLSSDRRMRWKRHSPKMSSNPVLPKEDHTTKSENGHYIYLEQSMNSVSAIMSSDNISFDTDKCLVLRYRMDSTSKLIISKDSESFEHKDNTTGVAWNEVSIQLGNGRPARIVIKGIIGNTSKAYIAVDDIDIQGWSCYQSLPVTCNFEEKMNVCNHGRIEIIPKQQGNLQWDRHHNGKGGNDPPAIDHTIGEEGFYIYTQATGHDASPRRLIIITFETTLKEGCLSLWYYIYGRNPGYLNIHVVEENLDDTIFTNSEKFLSVINDTITEVWSQFQVDLFGIQKIILEYNFTEKSFGGIALDDIYISPIICPDKTHFTPQCVDGKNELHIKCPVQDVWIDDLAFDPNIQISCKTSSKRIRNQLRVMYEQCNIKNNSRCVVTSADLPKNDCFPITQRVLVMYSCTDKKFPETSDNHIMSSSTHTYDTSISVTEFESKQTVSPTSQVKDNTGNVQSGSSSVIGVVVGVILSLVALSVILVIVIIYFRRYRYTERKGHSIVANEDSHTDYTGHQNTAFSPEVNVTTQTDYCEIRTSKHNDQYHDITDTFSPSINTTNDDEYSEIANVVNSLNNPNASTNYQHQYITLDPNATGFDRSNQHINLHNESRNNNNSNVKTSFAGADDYAILDPDDLNESKNNTPKVLQLSENYVVLDPNETGFNRQENTDTVCNYELATPTNPTETSEDPYNVYKDETYDTSSNSRHKEKDNHIYSHMVDNVYDTAGNQRKKEDSDGTYDHFFGQQSEDDYDISKPL